MRSLAYQQPTKQHIITNLLLYMFPRRTGISYQYLPFDPYCLDKDGTKRVKVVQLYHGIQAFQ